MTQYKGFLIRVNLGDTGTIPRSGTFTACPDILVAGQKALSTTEMIQNYNKSYNDPLKENFANNLYVRAKNTTSGDLTKNVYLFQVPQHLFLTPNVWYNESNLVKYNKVSQDPNHPGQTITTPQNFQTITAPANTITATQAFSWTPETTEHHCMVVVVDDNFDAVQQQFPPNISKSTNDYAQWIYSNGNIGWHNVSIQAVDPRNVYQRTVPFLQPFGDNTFTCSIQVKNAPVGATIGFSSNTNTKWGETIAVGDTKVPEKPGAKNPKINPSFNVGTNVKIQEGYAGDVGYYVNWNGTTPPSDFSMSFVATVSASFDAKLMTPEHLDLIGRTSLYQSYRNSGFDDQSHFYNIKNGALETGFKGFMRVQQELAVIPQIVTTLGSFKTQPGTGFQP